MVINIEKIDNLIGMNKERDEKLKIVEIIQQDLKVFKIETKEEIKELREKADKTDMLVQMQEDIEKLFINQDEFKEKVNFNSTEIQKINVILLDYNASQMKRDLEVKDLKKRIDDSLKKFKDI